MHDFTDKNPGKAAPYGVYDIGMNKGRVSVGIGNDTAEFAVNTIRAWRYDMGEFFYRNPEKIFITADSGGSNMKPEKQLRIFFLLYAVSTGLFMVKYF